MEIRNIPIEEVYPSPMNPRKTFDADALKELAENIRHHGLLQPITVRPINESGVAGIYTMMNSGIKYEIVCGERRYRAMSILHKQDPKMWPTIASNIREKMSDDEAFDAMITENLQRKDVNPIEEAFAFDQLIKKGQTAEEIAARFGKSIRFVQDRVKLNNLIPELMLKVRDGKMAIVAAMIIAKFDEDMQRKFRDAYDNYSSIGKQEAQRFADSAFMNIYRSAWYQSDNQEDEDFEGGCGRKCSECHLNTANASCLFWEMKADADECKCTHRPSFEAKHIAYMIRFLERESGNLVKKGDALEYGKTVIIDTANCWNTDMQRLHDNVIDAIAAKGYEIVKPGEIFGSRIFYSDGDERIDKMLKNGEIYRCIDVLSYNSLPDPKIVYYYLKPISKDGDATNGEMAPSDVIRLVGKYKRNIEIIDESKAKMLAKITSERVLFEEGSELCDAEQLVFDAFIIQTAPAKEYWERYGIDSTHYSLTSEDVYKIASKYPQDRNLWYREYLRQRFSRAVYHPHQFDAKLCRIVMEVWDAKECEALDAWATEQLEKKQKSVKNKLDELGYDIEGHKLKS